MKELLKAEFGRLFRSRMFRILVILDVLFNIYLIYVSEIPEPVSKTPYVYIEVTQLTMLIFVEVYSFVAGAFISLFIIACPSPPSVNPSAYINSAFISSKNLKASKRPAAISASFSRDPMS